MGPCCLSELVFLIIIFLHWPWSPWAKPESKANLWEPDLPYLCWPDLHHLFPERFEGTTFNQPQGHGSGLEDGAKWTGPHGNQTQDLRFSHPRLRSLEPTLSPGAPLGEGRWLTTSLQRTGIQNWFCLVSCSVNEKSQQQLLTRHLSNNMVY